MKILLTLGVLLPAVLIAATVAHAADDAGPPLAHAVYFTLKDRTPEARQKLVDSCRKYLTDHAGAISFSVGTLAEDVKEPVSDFDFDVALCVVFRDKAAKEQYLTDPRHVKFVEENRGTWSRVRVFDSYLAGDRGR
ncbi:MAG TPA: Dabb family protein [Isosphaeraceae bacterium]|jgi:hypothetical protein